MCDVKIGDGGGELLQLRLAWIKFEMLLRRRGRRRRRRKRAVVAVVLERKVRGERFGMKER